MTFHMVDNIQIGDYFTHDKEYIFFCHKKNYCYSIATYNGILNKDNDDYEYILGDLPFYLVEFSPEEKLELL